MQNEKIAFLSRQLNNLNIMDKSRVLVTWIMAFRWVEVTDALFKLHNSIHQMLGWEQRSACRFWILKQNIFNV